MGINMQKALVLLILVVSVVLFAGCGRGYLNKEFRYDTIPATIKLAVAPVVAHERDYIDSMATFLFEDTSGAQGLARPDIIRHSAETDEKLGAILSKVRSAEYSGDDYNRGPRLQDDLTDEELAYFRAAVDSADLVLFPIRLAITEEMSYVTGVLTMRLYDLHGGALIYERERELLVEGIGQHALRFLALGLFTKARDDYIKNYRDRYFSRE